MAEFTNCKYKCKGGVEVKTNQNEPMVRKTQKNLSEYFFFFEYFHEESVE